MATPSRQEPGWTETIEPQEALRLLAYSEQSRSIVQCHSIDNGMVLLVWGVTFLLDMAAFDLSRLLSGGPFPGLLVLAGLNSAVVVWRIWYGRVLPIRLRKTFTNRIIFCWSFYYMALVGLGVAGWIFLVGPYPPFWFSLIGLLGALPLFIAGWRQRRHAWRTSLFAVER